MDGFGPKGGPFYNVDPSWHAIGTGNFNGYDASTGYGASDILWQNDNGITTIWLIDFGSLRAAEGPFYISGLLYDVDPSWRMIGTGDFNNDGKSDILWQNTSSATTTWRMDGFSETGGPIYSVDPSWHPVVG